MELWRIKGQALRLMFADSDLNFDYDEFNDGVLLANGNTREKLVGMDDSVRRAIDLYYNHVGENVDSTIFPLTQSEGAYINKLDLIDDLPAGSSDIGFPSRIDALFHTENDGVKTLNLTKKQIDFSYDNIRHQVYFLDTDYSEYEDLVSFRVFYKVKKENLPFDAALTYDLDTIRIPVEVQRMIPYYIKGELFEEDEPNVALTARNLYMQFVAGFRRPFHNVQTKVKRARIFEK
jgi:hypothetical protein